MMKKKMMMDSSTFLVRNTAEDLFIFGKNLYNCENKRQYLIVL